MANKNYTPNILLRQAREGENLKQKDLADKLGTTAGVVGKWERGEVFPSPFYRKKLCALFSKSDEQLGLIREQYQDNSDEEADLTQTSTDHEQEQKVLSDVASPDLEMATNIASQQSSLPDQESQEQSIMHILTPPFGKGFVSKYKFPISMLSVLLIAVVVSVFLIPNYLQKPRAEINLSNITPADLAKMPPTTRDTFTDPYFLNWVTPPGHDAIRSCQFTPTGLYTIDRDNWPLALCFAQATHLIPPYAIQVAVTFPPDTNNTQAHSAGIVIAVSDPFSDNGSMKRFRVGDDQSYDIYTKSNDKAHTGRLDECPSLIDPHAQSTLHNDYDALTSSSIWPGTGKTNAITVVVGTHNMILYVNGQELQTACDASSNTGMIGLFGDSPWKKEFTEAVFNDLTIWTKF